MVALANGMVGALTATLTAWLQARGGKVRIQITTTRGTIELGGLRKQELAQRVEELERLLGDKE